MNLFPSSALMIYFKEYEKYHQTKGNKFCHMFGVPGVTFSLLGLLSHVVLWAPAGMAPNEALFQLDLGIILFLIGAIFSIKVDFKLSIPFLLAMYLMYLLSRHLPLSVLIGIQVLSWVFQLYGHYKYEKKSPAFFKNIESLLIGPMWVFAYFIRYYRPA